jgi:hypothetical protein
MKYNSMLECDIETWRCPQCNDTVDADGPPQCGNGHMRPGYECCAWCQEHYGPIAAFEYHDGDPLCRACVEWKHGESRSMWWGAFSIFALGFLAYWILHIAGCV